MTLQKFWTFTFFSHSHHTTRLCVNSKNKMWKPIQYLLSSDDDLGRACECDNVLFWDESSILFRGEVLVGNTWISLFWGGVSCCVNWGFFRGDVLRGVISILVCLSWWIFIGWVQLCFPTNFSVTFGSVTAPGKHMIQEGEIQCACMLAMKKKYIYKNTGLW